MSAAAELAVVVLSYQNEATILDAVDSLLSQDMPLEIVVSHSGGGPVPQMLRRRRAGTRVVACEERRYPGGARNAGIEATTAPYVGFLAGDCVARPGWAAARLARHRDGAEAVASALVPADVTAASVAGYLLAQSWRMPHLREIAAPFPGLYRHPAAGVSYGRATLERFGPFADDVLAGEDTLFNDRLRDAGVPIVWAPEVVTEHLYPRRPLTMLAEEHRRGRLRGSLHGGSRWKWRVAYGARAALEPLLAAIRATDPRSPVEIRSATVVGLLMAAGTLMRIAGILRGGQRVGPGAERFATRRHRRLLGRADLHPEQEVTARGGV